MEKVGIFIIVYSAFICACCIVRACPDMAVEYVGKDISNSK